MWADEPLILAKEKGVEVKSALDFNKTVQGAIYSIWREKYPAVHDFGYSYKGKPFRLFTFSPLLGDYTKSGERISFQGAVSLEIRSVSFELIDELAHYFIKHKSLQLWKHRVPVVDICSTDRIILASDVRIRTISPITLHGPNEKYYKPSEEQFFTRIASNLKNKLGAARRENNVSFNIFPDYDTLKEAKTRYGREDVTAYYGDFMIEADPSTIEFLYYTGLGDRNPQGFGMFEVLPCEQN